MAYTRAQWNNLQRRLPPEERESYETYLASNPPAAPKASSSTGPLGGLGAGVVAGVQIPKPVWSKAGVVQTLNGPVDVDSNGVAADGSVPIAKTAEPVAKWEKAAVVVTDAGPVDVDINGFAADGSRPVAKKVVTDNSITGNTGPATLPAAPTGPTLAINTFKNTLALFFGEAEVAKPWVNELYKLSSPYYKSGSSIDEALNLALQEGRNNPNLKEFATRFSGIFKLQDKLVSGVAVTVPTIAEYVASEAKMGEVLNAAGLGSLNTQQFLGDRIGDGVNVSEFTRRINDVYLRIDSLPQQAKSTISRYLPSIDKTQLAKALLTGTKGAAELAKEVSSYEVLSAAEQQGLGTLTTEGKAGLAGGVDLAQAAELSAMGYTFNTANQALGQVALAAPTYEKILEIGSGKDVTSGEATQMLIQADVKKLASAERAKAQAIAEEAARFAGSAGTSKVSFNSQRQGQF